MERWNVWDKMAPSFLVLWLFLNIVLVLTWDDAEQFIYDRKSFMEIGNAVLSGDYIGSGVTCLDFPSFSSFQWDIPDYLQRRPGATLRRKRRRRRGKRSGVAIRLKAEIGYRGRRSVWHIQEVSYRSIRPLVCEDADRHVQYSFSRSRPNGVNTLVLHSLNRGSESADTLTLLRMSLLNVRSLANKNFILCDFFTHNNLDILFMTETWIKDCDLSPFNELVPADCSFFNTRGHLAAEGPQFLKKSLKAELLLRRHTTASNSKCFNWK